MSTLPPQPVQIARNAESLQQDFIRVTMDRIPDPLWQYALVVRKNVTRVRPNDGLVPPTEAKPARSVGLLYREDIESDIEVVGVRLRFEIDPAHWLEEWLRFNGLAPASMLRWPLAGGTSGDAVVEWEIDGVPYAGRFATFKSGSRLFITCCRGRRGNYDRVADDFFITLAQFKLVQSDPGPLAEPVRSVTGSIPVPFRLLMPGSWTLSAAEGGEGSGTIQASAQPPAENDAAAVSATTPFPGLPEREPIVWPSSTWNAQLSATLAPASAIAGWDAAGTLCLSALRAAGLELEELTFVEEAPPGPFESSRTLTTPARLRGEPGAEVRCRLAKVGPLWLISAGVGVAREVNPHAWMRNARAHDLLAQTAEFEL